MSHMGNHLVAGFVVGGVPLPSFDSSQTKANRTMQVLRSLLPWICAGFVVLPYAWPFPLSANWREFLMWIATVASVVGLRCSMQDYEDGNLLSLVPLAFCFVHLLAIVLAYGFHFLLFSFLA